MLEDYNTIGKGKNCAIILQLNKKSLHLNQNILHEIGDYLHQIISNVEQFDSDDKVGVCAGKIKKSAYNIDALITDSTVKKIDVELDSDLFGIVDFTKFSGLNVLIVDDLPANIDIMKNIFSTFSCNITTALSGEEALELFKNGYNPDIITMDILMPGIDGTTTTIKLKEIGSEAYFIAISALKNQSHEIVSVFDCWLPKPFTKDHICSALAGYQMLDKKQRATETIPKAYKLDANISNDTKQRLLLLANNGAYSELERVISSLKESSSKEFLTTSLQKVDFQGIINSIVSS